jgi:uncharacterized membrane protein YhhN
VLTVASALACLVLVYAEYRGHARLRVAAKLAASAAFVALAMPAWDASPYARWMIVGLVFGAIGDVALLGHSKRWFLAGLVAFLIGHVAYVGGFAQLLAPERWFATAGAFAAIPIAIGGAVLVRLWPRFGALRIPVIGYVLVIVAMVIGAFAVYRGDALGDPERTRLLAGACLFFVSDLAVARNRFVGREFVNLLWGLPAYYAGQLLIAWSLTSSAASG